MSRKKDVALQEFTKTDEEFQAQINKPSSLTIVDCHQTWCGPCKMIITTLKRFKLEFGNEGNIGLNFVVACVDDLASLDAYKNSPPEPVFLFYAGGTLVDKLAGCNVPQFTKKIREQLANEAKVAAGEAERKEFVDTGPASPVASAKSSAHSVQPDSSATTINSSEAKELCFATITPAYLDNYEEIKQMLSDVGIEILAERQHEISGEEFNEIYPAAADQEGGADFIGYLTSGTSIVLIVTREGEHGIGVLKQMQQLVGPSSQAQAQAEAPDSINAKFGNMVMFTSVDAAMAGTACGLLFPDFAAPSISRRASSAQLKDRFTTFKIYGPCTENFQTQLQNFGCQIVQEAQLIEDHEGLPEEAQTSENFMLIKCQKSLTSMANHCQSLGDDGVFVEVVEGASVVPSMADVTEE